MSTTATKKERGNGKALIDVGRMDEIKRNGWRVEKLDDGGYTAYEVNGDRSMGPARTIAALHTLVMKEIGNKFELGEDDGAPIDDSGFSHPADLVSNDVDAGEVELESNSKGDRYLPGTAPLVNQELTNAIGKYHSIKMDRVKLTNDEKNAKDELIAMCHIHEALFVPDPDNDDSKIYRAGDLLARLSVKKEEKITTEIATVEE